MKEVGEDEEWTIFWTDYSVSLERVMEMKRFQVMLLNVNVSNVKVHFLLPSTAGIGREWEVSL